MLYAYRMVLYKVLLKKMRFRKLMLFFTGLPLENCEFLFRRCSGFCVEGCKKKDNFFHRQPNKAWRIPKSFKCSVYQRYFLDLSRIIFYGVVDTFLNLILCWSWKFGHFATPHSLSTTTAGTSIRATKKWRHVLNSSFYELSNERIDI